MGRRFHRSLQTVAACRATLSWISRATSFRSALPWKHPGARNPFRPNLAWPRRQPSAQNRDARTRALEGSPRINPEIGWYRIGTQPFWII